MFLLFSCPSLLFLTFLLFSHLTLTFLLFSGPSLLFLPFLLLPHLTLPFCSLPLLAFLLLSPGTLFFLTSHLLFHFPLSLLFLAEFLLSQFSLPLFLFHANPLFFNPLLLHLPVFLLQLEFLQLLLFPYHLSLHCGPINFVLSFSGTLLL